MASSNVSGVYQICHVESGKVYIGSSKHVPRRLYAHRYWLARQRHPNRHLQRAWNMHGAEAFAFAMVEPVADACAVLIREQSWIDATMAADGIHGFNACPVAGSREGTKQPESVAIKLRAVHTGKPKSAEQRAKMSAAAKGKIKSPEHCEKLRQAGIRQFASAESRLAAAEYAKRRTRAKPQDQLALL